MKLEKLFDFEIVQTEDVELAGASGGDLLISPTSGGTFSGDRMRGTMMPIGLGTTRTRGRENDIRSETLLRTEDGCDIWMSMEAIFDVDPDIEAKLIAGEQVNPDSYYYRGIIRFETGAEKYRWLERKICVCTCEIEDYTKLHLTVFMV